MLNSALRACGKGPLLGSGSVSSDTRKSTQSSSSSYSAAAPEPKKEIVDYSKGSSHSDRLVETYLSNAENILSAPPSLFRRKLTALDSEINSPDLHPYETDRLLFLKALFNLLYFDEHYLDDNFDDSEAEYISILDEIDDLIRGMSSITDEAAYLYYVANMFSIGRFENIEPLDKLKQLWSNIGSIHLNNSETEMKVSFWHENAKRIHDLMERIYTPDPPQSSQTPEGNDQILMKVKKILSNKLGLHPSDITLNSVFTRDLGCDSLDLVELIMEFEKAFGISISDEHAEKISTVRDAVRYIERAIK